MRWPNSLSIASWGMGSCMYNKVYFSDGICVTVLCNCLSGGCSAALSPHLVWDTVGLQVSCVSCLVWWLQQLCFFMQCKCLGNYLGYYMLIIEMGQLYGPLPTFCSQNQVPLFIITTTAPPPLLKQKPALGCCKAVNDVSTVLNRSKDYKQNVSLKPMHVFISEL